MEGTIVEIGDDFEGKGLPFIAVGFVPAVYCPLARIADDELIALRRDDPIVVKGKFVIPVVDEILMLFFMEGCEIVEWEELGYRRQQVAGPFLATSRQALSDRIRYLVVGNLKCET